jgi:hypothetical protein
MALLSELTHLTGFFPNVHYLLNDQQNEEQLGCCGRL